MDGTVVASPLGEVVLSPEVRTRSVGRNPSAYANQSAGGLSSMCDTPQTEEALTVRRSRDVLRLLGGV